MLSKYPRFIVSLMAVMACLSMTACSGSEKTEAAGGRTPRPEGVPADFPSKPIEIAHAWPAGSATEAFVRIVMEDIKEKENWDNGFTIGFHEGASGQIGWSYMANAKPDGYVIGIAQGTSMINPAAGLTDDYGLDKFSYISNMMTIPGAIGVTPDSKYKSLEDLVEAALAAPGEISVATGGMTTSDGIAVRQVELATGCKFNIVPAGDSEAIPMMLGGFVDCAWLNVDDFTSYVEAGEAVVIATGGKERAQAAPDVPTFTEQGIDVVQANMRAIVGPEGLDESIRQYLEDCFIASMNDPEVQEKAKNLNLPYQIKTGSETYQDFSDLYNSLKELWETQPWQ